jgi:large subunit ribosomal protein L7/L12
LKEAKDLADKTPSMLKKNMKRDEAEKLKKDLEAVGCVINLK